MTGTLAIWSLGALGALSGLIWIVALVMTVYAISAVPRLPTGLAPERDWPRLSLVRPACNEEATIEAAARSALDVGYPDLQLVLINDRSEDATPALVDALAREHEHVLAIHINTLPQGWLGKLNALQHGVERADGDWLLFADADTHFASNALQHAVAWAEAREVDFVSVLPRIEPVGLLTDAVWSATNAFFGAAVRPWRIETEPDAVAATGAFMLVRRTAFERTPGFEWLRLEVSDDFGLCLMIKEFGGKAGFLVAPDSVRLTWYRSFGEMVRSLQKNFYAISGRFSLSRCLFQALVLVLLAVGPFAPLALAASSPWLAVVSGISVAAGLLNGLAVSRWMKRPLLPSLLPWLGLFLTAGIVVRSAIVGTTQGGILWRGVLYPNEMLRDAQRVRF